MGFLVYSISSDDLPDEFSIINLEQVNGYEAATPQDVIFQITIELGPDNLIGSDMFQCMVVSENNVHQLPGWSKYISFPEYSWKAFRDRLKNIFQTCQKDDWESSLFELRKHFNWEFDGLAGVRSSR